MIKYLIKLSLSRYSDATLLAFAQTILSLMTGNLNYTTPHPTLIVIGGLITDFSDALTAWGLVGNRGSHAQHVAVLDTRAALEIGLTSLSDYCMTTTVYDRAAFISGGWEVKNGGAPIGPLPAAANLREANGKTTPDDAIQLRWARVNGAKTYNVLRSDDDGATWKVVAMITKASFVDRGLDSSKTYQYAVQAIGAAGTGATSDICLAQPKMNPVS